MAKHKPCTTHRKPVKSNKISSTIPEVPNIPFQTHAEEFSAPINLKMPDSPIKRQKFSIDSILNKMEPKAESGIPDLNSVKSYNFQNSAIFDCFRNAFPQGIPRASPKASSSVTNPKCPPAAIKVKSTMPKGTSSQSPEGVEIDPGSSHHNQDPNWAPAGGWSGTWTRSDGSIAKLKCNLEPENKKLWDTFNRIGTEMIITKPGRRMFPTVRVRLEDCNPDTLYYVYMDCIPVDGHRYRYVYKKSDWCSSGKADTHPPNRTYMHPDSPFTASQLLASPNISFEKAKLTNNTETDVKDKLLILNSMHKYQPRVHVLEWSKSQEFPLPNGGHDVDLKDHPGRYKTFVFKETRFMAVTAYQNQLVTEMKIKNNPFAKGFRESDKNGDNPGRTSIGTGGVCNPNGLNGCGNQPSPPPPSHLSMNLQPNPLFYAPHQAPNPLLVTFAQIAPFIMPILKYVPSTAQQPIVSPEHWHTPWYSLPANEKNSFAFFYDLVGKLASGQMMAFSNMDGQLFGQSDCTFSGPSTSNQNSAGSQEKSSGQKCKTQQRRINPIDCSSKAVKRKANNASSDGHAPPSKRSPPSESPGHTETPICSRMSNPVYESFLDHAILTT
ncbi:t-box domain-containing protein [Ditylenchus destructor]|uniref:T-box domain-containing protein n=1 Tax=Ditylenchus destructor TaxID=166010 RepID=A0AAD4MNT5_9BILA|nr:t-box domain-containing protein [Ditylenchus destructor]